jgi:hypothetical protein
MGQLLVEEILFSDNDKTTSKDDPHRFFCDLNHETRVGVDPNARVIADVAGQSDCKFS